MYNNTSARFDDGARPAPLSEGVTVETARFGEPLHAAAERFVYQVYLDAGYCTANDREVVEELEGWAERATYHLAVYDGAEVIGTLRTIIGDVDDLQIGQFDLYDGVVREHVCELSALALAPSRRGSGVIEHLYRSAWRTALEEETSWLAGMVDPWLLEVIADSLGLPFHQTGAPMSYMGGSDGIPVALPLTGDAYEKVAAKRQGFWDWGLEGLTQPLVERAGFPNPRAAVLPAG